MFLLFSNEKAADIYIDSLASEGVKRAAFDLRENLLLLSGKESGFEISSDPAGQEIVIKIDPAASSHSEEGYLVTVTDDGVEIVGYDILGTVYGIYAFATKCLGIDPMYRFTDIFPSEREALWLNPQTVVYLEEGATMHMESTQIKGIDSTNRLTKATLKAGAEFIVKEKLYTHGVQTADTDFVVDMQGENCKADIISRSVAADKSRQNFVSTMNGFAPCYGHTECDAIIMDEAQVKAAPCLSAAHVDAQLIHEAAIGKIAGEQLIKLMTLGLTEREAEEQIIKGFLH